MRKSWMIPYTSTTPSRSIWKINRSMAMKVPVRPTPALYYENIKWYKNQNLYVYSVYCLYILEFRNYSSTCSAQVWVNVLSTGPCVLGPGVWNWWEAQWSQELRGLATQWNGSVELIESLLFSPVITGIIFHKYWLSKMYYAGIIYINFLC